MRLRAGLRPLICAALAGRVVAHGTTASGMIGSAISATFCVYKKASTTVLLLLNQGRSLSSFQARVRSSAGSRLPVHYEFSGRQLPMAQPQASST